MSGFTGVYIILKTSRRRKYITKILKCLQYMKKIMPEKVKTFSGMIIFNNLPVLRYLGAIQTDSGFFRSAAGIKPEECR